jgi:hypothetical protein
MTETIRANEHVQLSIQRLIAVLGQQQFFGTVELKFEKGRIVLLRKTETIKPEDYRDNRGVTDELHSE